MDLGGGSTQVTFAPKDVQRTPLLADYMHEVSTPNAKIEVFTNSYLNLGLQAVRNAVFTDKKNQIGDMEFVSECINPIVQKKPFRYGAQTFTVR